MELLHLKQKQALGTGLSLAPPCENADALLKKRKRGGSSAAGVFAGLMQDVELEQHPLPSGWEQCLDLQSGEMYYVNPVMSITTKQDPRKGFKGPVSNDWKPVRLDPFQQQNLFSKNSYSDYLQRMDRTQVAKQAHLPATADDLDLSLNLFTSHHSPKVNQSQV